MTEHDPMSPEERAAETLKPRPVTCPSLARAAPLHDFSDVIPDTTRLQRRTSHSQQDLNAGFDPLAELGF